MVLKGGTAAPITLAGSVSSDTATFDLTTAQSLTLATGTVEWGVVLDDGADDRVTVSRGTTCVLPDPAAATPASHASTCLALVETRIQGQLVNGEDSISYLGVNINYLSPAELEALRSKYKAEINSELATRQGINRSPFRTIQLNR